MKAKITRGKSFRGLLNYLLDHGRGEVIGGNMSAVDKIGMSLEFGAVRALRPDISRPVWHCSLSLPPGDDLSTDHWQDVAADFLRKVRELGFAVKLDTNGCHPAALAEILEAGLADYVAMDVKNSRARYAETVGVPGFDLSPVEESVRLLRESGVDCEFRTTLVRELHRPEDLDDIAVWLEGAPKYFLQNFVDSGNLIGRGYHGFSPEELRAFADRVRPHFGCVALRGVE